MPRAERKLSTQPPGRRRLNVAPFTEIGIDHWQPIGLSAARVVDALAPIASDKSSSKSQSER